MRVLMVSDVYFPRVNGVSTSIQTFRRELATQGVTVDLIAPSYPGEVDEAGIWRIPSRYVAIDPEDRLMRRGQVRDLLPRLRGAGYQLVHVQTPFIAHYAGLEIARALGVPVVTTYHTFFEEYLHHYARGVPASWTRALARRFSRGQCNATDGVVAPSGAMCDALRQYGVTVPIEVIPTGIPLERFQGGDRAAFRRAHGLGQQQEVALFVGRVAHEKNIGLLLQVAERLRYRRPAFVLLIAGEGPALGSLQVQAQKLGLGGIVRFIGYLDRSTSLIDCYRAADLFVFGSTTETQGLVLLEAMAMGLPVVAIPAMGARDILLPERGCLCAKDDAIDFAEKVERVLQQPDLHRRLATEAQAYAQRWSAPATAERMADFYKRTVVTTAMNEASPRTGLKSRKPGQGKAKTV